jgi:hypothetical protein
VKYTTIAQLIGLTKQRVVFQVEYVENDSDSWTWLPHSQHEASFADLFRIGTNQLIYENAKSEALAEARALSQRYEEVRIVKLSAEQMWRSGQENGER